MNDPGSGLGTPRAGRQASSFDDAEAQASALAEEEVRSVPLAGEPGAGAADRGSPRGERLVPAVLASPGASSTVATTCPFLRAAAPGAELEPPAERPDGANRCAALTQPQPLSPRQQELVCLTRGHLDCPRYRHGLANVAAAGGGRRGRRLTTATAAALALLAASVGASLAFVVVRGNLDLPVATGGAGGPAAAAGSPAASRGAPGEGNPSAPASGEPGATADAPAPTPTRAASTPPTPAPTAPPTPGETPEPGTPEPVPPELTDPRFALLEPCPDADDCWLYTIEPGDNLYSIGQRFGVPLETIYERNPWAEGAVLHPGDELRLPAPAD